MVVKIDNHGLHTVTTKAQTVTGRDTIGPVPTPDDLARQADAVRRVTVARLRRERAHRTADQADREWRDAILAALDAGAMMRDVAEAAGVTRQYIRTLRDR